MRLEDDVCVCVFVWSVGDWVILWRAKFSVFFSRLSTFGEEMSRSRTNVRASFLYIDAHCNKVINRVAKAY